MPLGRARARRERHNFVRGTALFALVICLVGGSIYFLLHRAPPLNETTLCPASDARAYVALLVDKTDPLPFTQRQAFVVVIRDLVSSVQPGELVDVFAVGEDYKAGAE